MRFRYSSICILVTMFALPLVGRGDAASTFLPDGRSIGPVGFTIPVEGFASNAVRSPDGSYVAVLSEAAGAIDIIDARESVLADRLAVPSATNLAWTSDGLYVSRGYTGKIARYTFAEATKPSGSSFTKRPDLDAGGPGLLDGIVEDPATHRIAVARTADRVVLLLDDRSDAVLATLHATGQPFDVAFVPRGIIATDYDRDRVDLWRDERDRPTSIVTGPHPTRLLVDGVRAYVADADGSNVALIDTTTARIVRQYDLAAMPDQPPGQTPSGMALSSDRATLFVCESGFNDVAVVDVRSGSVRTRIPTAWYPMAVASAPRALPGGRRAPASDELWVLSARGLGQQPDPAGEWNGHMTGMLQHLIVDRTQFGRWSAQVARYDRFAAGAPAVPPLPPIRHVVFIVHENKHFDEEFGDEPRANADPTLLVYGRSYTPNLHALAERYTMFDAFMGNGDASIFGHAWAVQGFTNDYHERNAHAFDESTKGIAHRVAFSIWPYPQRSEDALTPHRMDRDWYTNLAELPGGPRQNTSAIFGPRGELVDELARHHVSFRVFGEQLTMLRDGRIAPALSTHADRDYPGTHINFGVLDTDRAKLFARDVEKHGLAAYTYLTLPVDHTADSEPGYLTPQSYVADNDAGLGAIVATLSKRPEWKSTVIFFVPDDAQGTGDHVDAKRMPVIAVGPYVKRGAVVHTLYSFPSILRTVETLFHVGQLSIEDAASAPMLDAFASTPDLRPYAARPETIGLVKNAGKAVSLWVDLDGPGSKRTPDGEWAAVHGSASLRAHHAYLARLEGRPTLLAAAFAKATRFGGCLGSGRHADRPTRPISDRYLARRADWFRGDPPSGRRPGLRSSSASLSRLAAAYIALLYPKRAVPDMRGLSSSTRRLAPARAQ